MPVAGKYKTRLEKRFLLFLSFNLLLASNTFYKSKGQGSPDGFTHRCVGASGGCSGGRENVLAVGNCC